jgi:hypothetical protein
MPLPGAGPAAGVADCAPDWLALREPADAAARSTELVDLLTAHESDRRSWVVRDLGCGTGSMGRWLAPRLPGAQHWLLHDRDAALLALAALPDASADGGPVTVRTVPGDVTITAATLAGTSLVTASALLDLLTAEQVDALAAACVAAGCPALLTLSVSGRVLLDPPDLLDARVAAAFDAHQRRELDGRRLLGPDAPDVAAAAFARLGWTVHRRPSPWRLEPGPLTDEWLGGWIASAREQEPDLPLDGYRATPPLRAVVGHEDLLALPPGGGPR